MKFKSYASPAVWPGVKIDGPKIVVPDQAMSLHEILERFTRNEELPIGKDVQYHESDDDLEKISHMDLVDRAEYVQKLQETQKMYKAQEAKKDKAEKDRLLAEAKAEAKKEAEKAVKAELKP